MAIKRSIRLLILNPVSTDIWNDLVYKAVSEIVEESTRIDVRNLREGPPAIETEYDKTLAEHYVVEEVVKAEKEGYDAVVINCFDDPGLNASREVVKIPVFGIGETSIIYSLLLGHHIAIISTGRNSLVAYRRRVRELGVENRVVYVSGIDIPVLKLRESIDLTKDHLIKEIVRARDVYGADVIVLGCGGLIGLARELSEETGVVIIDPTLVTVKIAEATTRLGYTYSRIFLVNRLATPYT